MIKHLYLTPKLNPNKYYHSESECTGRNGIEGIFYVPQSFRTVATPSDSV